MLKTQIMTIGEVQTGRFELSCFITYFAHLFTVGIFLFGSPIMRIKFQAGSYNLDNSFVRSIARYRDKQGENNWRLESLLININHKYSTEYEASMLAKVDIDHARIKAMENRGTYTMDHYLSALGYQKVADE